MKFSFHAPEGVYSWRFRSRSNGGEIAETVGMDSASELDGMALLLRSRRAQPHPLSRRYQNCISRDRRRLTRAKLPFILPICYSRTVTGELRYWSGECHERTRICCRGIGL